MKSEELIETKECEEYLSCVLTPEELLDRSKKLAKANEDAEDLAKRKKDVTADFSAQQKKVEARIALLTRVVSSGKEYRDNVKCEWTYNYTQGYKQLKRLDTGEVIKHQELTQKERQGTIT